MLGNSFLDTGGREYSNNPDEVFNQSRKPRKKEARTMARKLIKDIGITEAPVNLRQVISHLQEDSNLVVASRDFTENISGMIVKVTDMESETIAIGFNVNDPWCRRRFTIAHEIGHLKFDTLCNKHTESQSIIEQECNVFAAELLMPRELLKEDFKKIPNIPELSKKYLMSQESLGIKLGDDGLLRF